MEEYSRHDLVGLRIGYFHATKHGSRLHDTAVQAGRCSVRLSGRSEWVDVRRNTAGIWHRFVSHRSRRVRGYVCLFAENTDITKGHLGYCFPSDSDIDVTVLCPEMITTTLEKQKKKKQKIKQEKNLQDQRFDF